MHDCMTQEDAMNMDNKQAAQILIPLRDMMMDQHGCPISDAWFALDKAIDALSTQPNGDLISRQAAIDAMAELQGMASTKAELKGISKAWKRIKHLPSAQPEIIRCKECKWYIDIRSLNTDENKNARLCALSEKYMSMQDYCSLAERRTDE